MCSQHAIAYRSEKQVTKELLKSTERVAALCDPSISGEFVDISDYRKFVAMIRALGFDLVNEVAFGVDVVAMQYQKLLDEFQGKYYISTKCPATVAYIEKMNPDLVENLAPIIPPYVAMAKIVHKKYGTNTRTVYITSCTAAKDEAKMFKGENKVIDSVITFNELRELFKEQNVSEKSVEYSEFDPPLGRKGGLFPVSHGMFQAVDINQGLLDASVLITEGRTNFLQSIDEFTKENELKQHLDLFYCKGCIMGPGTSPGGRKFTRRSQVIKYVRKRMENINCDQWRADVKEYSTLNFSRTFKAKDKRMPFPSEEQIQKVLHEMGKSKTEDQLGCGACGYPSCREFAVAHVQGLTNYEMCYTYTIKQLHTYINKVNSANEKLKRTQDALTASEEKARIEEQGAREAAETTTAMLNKIRAGMVIVDKDLKILESNKSFINLLGEDARQIDEMIPGLKGAELESLVPFSRLFASVLQSGKDILNRDTSLGEKIFNVSVFTIKKNRVVGGIIRDLTAPDVRREEVINRARNVIRENLETVQQIAFLLGESASKTEKTLNSIIEAQKLGEREHGSGK
jgi:hypothetical protein